MAAYYNDNDPFAAAWLRELIKARLIPAGDVDTRSIAEVQPDDLKGYVHVSFFAGIGGWAYALRRAGWPDDRPVWTGSCPCQPFSAAGKQLGEKDERHLWPEFYRLIKARRPAAILGEQVASRLGREWLSGVRADLEKLGYDIGAADLCSASAGAPHIRQRLHWAAYTRGEGRRALQRPGREDGRPQIEPDGYGDVVGLAYTDGGCAGNGDLQSGRQYRQQSEDNGVGRLGDASSEGSGRHAGAVSGAQGEGSSERLGAGGVVDQPVIAGAADGLGDANDTGSQGRHDRSREGGRADQRPVRTTGEPGNVWSVYDIVHCTDGKTRRFESGSFPLAHRVAARVGRLRGYGNAINPELAAIFIKACEAARRG